MNKLVQIKKIVALVSFFGLLPLCAMENEPNRRSPRLAKKQLALERKLYAESAARGKVNEKKRRTKTELAYDHPAAKPLRKRAKIQNNSVSQHDWVHSGLDTVMMRPVMAEEFRKLIGKDRKNSTTNLSVEDRFDAAILRDITIGDLVKVIYKDSGIKQ